MSTGCDREVNMVDTPKEDRSFNNELAELAKY